MRAGRTSVAHAKRTPTRPPPPSRRCTICLCDYSAGDSLRALPCRHEFHLQCIDQWLNSNVYCPLCKQDVATLVAQQSAAMSQAADTVVSTMPVASQAWVPAAQSAALPTSSQTVTATGTRLSSV